MLSVIGVAISHLLWLLFVLFLKQSELLNYLFLLTFLLHFVF